jgi:hypothetical protein
MVELILSMDSQILLRKMKGSYAENNPLPRKEQTHSLQNKIKFVAPPIT